MQGRRRAVLAIAALAACAAPDAARSAAAQQPRRIEARAVAPGVTALRMHPDGTALVVARGGSTLVVDAGAPAHAARVDSAVAAHAGGAVRYVVSTHPHEDHLGANPVFRRKGAELIGHRLLPAEAAKDTTIASLEWTRRAAPPEALPTRVFDDSLVLRVGDEVAVVIHVPRAHTRGDAFVHLVRANVLHAGDIVELGAFPFVDRWAGGSIDGLIAATDAILARTDDATRTVPGHGDVASREDVVAYRAMLAALYGRVARAVANGDPVDALIRARITAPYEARNGGERQGSRFERLLYDELALQERSNR